MDADQLHRLLPDLDTSDIRRASALPAVQAAVKDLGLALSELSRCETGSKSMLDWETTKDELLTEIRRLTQKVCKAP